MNNQLPFWIQFVLMVLLVVYLYINLRGYFGKDEEILALNIDSGKFHSGRCTWNTSIPARFNAGDGNSKSTKDLRTILPFIVAVGMLLSRNLPASLLLTAVSWFLYLISGPNFAEAVKQMLLARILFRQGQFLDCTLQLIKETDNS